MENVQADEIPSVKRAFAQTSHARNPRNAGQRSAELDSELSDKVAATLTGFTRWLDGYGETSWDHQSFFAGAIGRRAKSLYYRHKVIGTAAVAPMIFSEAFLPQARRLFHHRIRFPIADAHYAMGFAFLYEATQTPDYLEKASHFLNELRKSRSPEFREYCWGYPFDWVTRGGLIKKDTPLITTTPYAWEAFVQLYELQPREEWREILTSIARHAATDIKDYPASTEASSCSYTPYDKGGVINAAAYRAFLLTSAAGLFGAENYAGIAKRNLNFVLENQNDDGSWYYAMDQVRNFVDHYHTCFVMKALGKIYALTADERCYHALKRGTEYYLKNLFDQTGLPKPFSKAPRLTVYKRELYDCAECVNLGLVLREWFPVLDTIVERVINEVATKWVKADGSFRSRQLHFGWDNVPMHRWGQAQMFRSLAYYLREAKCSKD
jgi:hypothetical protein